MFFATFFPFSIQLAESQKAAGRAVHSGAKSIENISILTEIWLSFGNTEYICPKTNLTLFGIEFLWKLSRNFLSIICEDTRITASGYTVTLYAC